MRNNVSEKDLATFFRNDKIGSSPSPAVETRLNYAFLLKRKGFKIYQNSILGSFTWLFSLKYIPLKAAFVSIALLVSLYNIQQKAGQYETPVLDSTMINMPFNIDTFYNPAFNTDTCLFLES